MENKGELSRRSEGVGAPTRLQKHAPTSLDINKVLSDRPLNPFVEASKAIPLLSPLTVSPRPKPVYTEITIQALTASENNSNNGITGSSSIPDSGWEHPAIASFPESSSLCSYFQKQCVFVNHAQ